VKKIHPGNTALYYAVKRKLKSERIEFLLRFGGDFNKKNNEGISPKMLAETNRERNILKLFS
jgi:ankyrin repeat protein